MNIEGYAVEYITKKPNERGQKKFYKDYDVKDELKAMKALEALRKHEGVKLAYLLVKITKNDQRAFQGAIRAYYD